MSINFSAGEGTPAALLEATEDLYRTIAEELAEAMRDIRAGRGGDIAAAKKAVRDLRDAFQIVMDERARVEKLRRQVAGVVAGGELDLDAARDEIGRRLARLRDGGSGG
ncbi:MAG: hypothetical protein IE927_08390 [Rhodobacterales bacterium]|nr:hypothetical protein [Rhodobacterales bacterium]